MKDLHYLTLMDIYGNALTEKQRDMLADYYERDFSLSEIADNYGISRQAVHFAVKQAEDSLNGYEEKFGVCAFIAGLNIKMDMLKSALPSGYENELNGITEYIRSNYGTVRKPQ